MIIYNYENYLRKYFPYIISNGGNDEEGHIGNWKPEHGPVH